MVFIERMDRAVPLIKFNPLFKHAIAVQATAGVPEL